MGVPEPFSGNPSGDVVFNILNDDIPNSFQAACKKLGKFFFLHLYASFDRPTNHKKRSYRFRIEAVFTSHNTLSIKPISLRNVTEVVVNILDAQENCPIFLGTFINSASLIMPVFRRLSANFLLVVPVLE
ncbi:unnamed protein product [Heterobilharzia americana]|nr:unnamed protein product [Heterobilharzia americana]